VAIIAFGPGLLTARGTSLGDAGFVVSLAIWLTMVSVPLGGLVSDRLRRPNVLIVGGCLVAAVVTGSIPAFLQPLLAFGLVGLAIGAPPGALMALLPNVVPSERLAAAFGVYYTMYYVVMAVVQLAAGAVRDFYDSPAAPIYLAALVMAATILGLVVFRLIERRGRTLTTPPALL
jgi:MFS family permease